MGPLLQQEQYLLEQRVIICRSRFQLPSLASTVHLHATQAIPVTGIDEFNIFIGLSITRVSILPL